MAKRKTHRRRRSHSVTTRRRRRSVGALALKAGSPLVKYGSMAAGYFLSDKVHEQIDKILPDSTTADTNKTKIVNGILAAGGLYFLFMSKGKKSVFVEALAGFAAGVGAKGLLMDFGILSGFRSMPVLNGFNDVPVIGNYNVPSPSLNGMGNYAVPSGVVGSVPPEYAETASGSGSGINNDNR